MRAWPASARRAPKVIVTGSPSCVTPYRRAKGGLPVLYLSEFLDKSLRSQEGKAYKGHAWVSLRRSEAIC